MELVELSVTPDWIILSTEIRLKQLLLDFKCVISSDLEQSPILFIENFNLFVMRFIDFLKDDELNEANKAADDLVCKCSPPILT